MRRRSQGCSRGRSRGWRGSENNRYQDTLFEVKETENLCYARVPGYWSEMGNETDVTDKVFRMTEAISEVPLDLHLDIIVPQQPEIEGTGNRYYVRPYPLKTSWQVEGGVIVRAESNTVEVAWIGNAPRRSLTASVLLPYGVGATATRECR